MVLILKGNRLSRIPFGIRRLKSVRTLNLADNQLKSLPKVFARMSFDTLDLSGAEMFTPPLDAHIPSSAMLAPISSGEGLRQPATLWQIAANIIASKMCVISNFVNVKLKLD